MLRRRIWKTLAFTTLGLIVTAAVLVSLVWFRFEQFEIKPAGSVTGEAVYLLVGTDAGIPREPGDIQAPDPAFPDRSRADAIVLLRLGADGSASAFSIPRDLLVVDKDGAPTRLALTQLDGPKSTIAGICSGLGVRVNRYIGVDTRAFVSAVDALGGVEVKLPEAVRDPRAALPEQAAGTQWIDGATALALVRSRHSETQVDGAWQEIGTTAGTENRTRWAGLVLDALRKRASEAGPVTIGRAVWEVSDGTVIGGGIHPGELRALTSASVSVKPLPVEYVGESESVLGDAGLRALDAAGFATSCGLQPLTPATPERS